MVPTFELRSLPDEKQRPRLYLIQLPFVTKTLPPVDAPKTIARLDGPSLKLALPAVATILNVDVKAMEAAVANASAPSPVTEGQALRLGLICNVVNSLRSPDKVQRVVDGIAGLDERKATLWLEEILADPSENARRALIVRFTGEL